MGVAVKKVKDETYAVSPSNGIDGERMFRIRHSEV
jgi:hypothetical protein